MVETQKRIKLSEDSQAIQRASRDFSSMELKGDHEDKPLWVCEDGHIFLVLPL